MCGIVAWLSLDGRRPVDRPTLEAMTRALQHRGPDDEGFFCDGPVGLGHRRLSIIDLAGGHQPLSNEDGSKTIVFNGEVYNFLDLRPELERAGHRFATRTDTEAMVHLYEEAGVECVRRFNGMFAFALWDAEKRRLFCARDRMGKKPLYYTVVDGALLVASELKALFRHPRVSRRIDPKALSAYLAFEYVPSPMAIVEGVAKLEGGHYFVVDLDRPPSRTADVEQVRYWDIPFRPVERPDDVIAGELIEHLRRAVERRLISDVPLGVFLSGGIDSSAIVSMMTDICEPKNIKTFTIAFQESTFDESPYARRVAEYFGVDHSEESMPALRALDILPEVARTLDEPMADSSILPTALLCEFTRRHVTVALGGDGGDELFAGYDPFQALVAGRWAARAPRWLRSAAAAALERAPVSYRNMNPGFILKHFLKGLDLPPSQRLFGWMGSFLPAAQREILAPEVLAAIRPEEAFSAADAHWRHCPAEADALHRYIYQYCKLYLQDDILVKVDRASMAYSLEARAPMLDPEFVEWVGTVPSNRKLRGLTKKYILKRAMEGRLPPDIIHRRKKGFGIPLSAWMRGPLRTHLEDRLGERSLNALGLFRPHPIRRLATEHLAGARDHRKLLWTLLCLVEWFRVYGQ
ncbi:MAG: asparagine synthase (glutamine-hydrolyzing) [Candidatus Sumerlaeota bacterium]|nr:asparagine synthase (glutamine-hydrolyzing) [Candidatus Sumerlaeota bacterium]